MTTIYFILLLAACVAYGAAIFGAGLWVGHREGALDALKTFNAELRVDDNDGAGRSLDEVAIAAYDRMKWRL